MRPLPLLLLLAATSAHADWTTGQDVWPAVFVDVTPEGFGSIEGIVRSVLPPTFPIAVPQQTGQLFDIGLVGIEYEVRLDNFYVVPTVNQADIVPIEDALDVALGLGVALNSASDPAMLGLYVDIDWLFGLISSDIDAETNLYTTRPIPVTATTQIGLEVLKNDRVVPPQVIFDADGNIQLDATFGEIVLDVDLRQGDLEIDGPFLVEAAEFFAELAFGSVEEFLLAELEPIIDEQVATAVAPLEEQVEDLFKSLNIQQTVDLLGTPLDVRIYPRDFYIDEEGLRLEMQGAFDPGDDPHPCIERYDTGLSLQTIPPVDPRYPALADRPLGAAHHLALLVNDDWVNQALYSVWFGGLLCQQISSEASPVELPVPLDSALLSLLAAGQFDEFFPETKPLIMATRPEKPPIARSGAQSLVDIEVDTLGLDLYSELDHRMMRVVGFDLAAVAGLDVTFDEATGEVTPAIDFDPEAIAAEVVFNDLNAAASPQMQAGFSTLTQTLVAPLLGDALALPTFAVPAIQGLGLQTGDVITTGPIADFLGVYGTLGTVAYGEPAGGCEGLGDIGGELGSGGCDLGCSSGAVPLRVGWLGLPLLLAWRRRRT